MKSKSEFTIFERVMQTFPGFGESILQEDAADHSMRQEINNPSWIKKLKLHTTQNDNLSQSE